MSFGKTGHKQKGGVGVFLFIILLVAVLSGVLGYAVGAYPATIQKPNQTATITLTNGVLVNDVSINWAANTVTATLDSTVAISGTLTVTSLPGNGSGSTAYSLTANTPTPFTVTMTVPLTSESSITVKD